MDDFGDKNFILNFFSFLLFSPNSSNPDFEVSKNSGLGYQTAFLSCRETISRLLYFFENNIFFDQFGTLSGKKRWEFSDFFSAGLPKMQFSCPANTLRKDNSAKSGTILTFYWTLNKRKIWLRQKTLQKECRNCFLRVQRNIWTETVFLKILYFVG